MKKIILILVCFMLGMQCYSQEYRRNGKEFSQVKQETVKQTDSPSGYTWKDSKGNVYDIYISKKGSCYIIKTSRKTGKQYRQYLPKEVSSQIARELGMDTKKD